MAKTLFQAKCPFCGRLAREEERFDNGDGWFTIRLECGHEIMKEVHIAEEVEIISKDGRRPFPFQVETTKFIEAADCNGLILHEQGLGKTVIECMLLKRNPHLLPALIIVKSGLREQWRAEIYRWTGLMPQVIMSSNDTPLLDTFPIIIISVDMLRRVRPDVTGTEDDDDDNGNGWNLIPGRDVPVSSALRSKKKKTPPIWTDDLVRKFNHICIDESQKIKKPGSARTQAVRLIAKIASGGDKQDKQAHVICMSGTNIEKHAGEFFVTLNLVRPELFPQEAGFKLRHCEVGDYGKIYGLKRPDEFKELTKDFIIRYRRSEVLPELPKVFRQFRLSEMPNGDVLEQYKSVVKDFMDYMADIEKAKNPTDILGYLTTMRRLTGIAKVDSAVDFTEEFLLGHDNDEKLVIFLHHKQAAALLLEKLTVLFKKMELDDPLQYSADLNLQQRTDVIERFKENGNRVLVASTLAAGEGLNLQFCSNCLIMERQWNPSYEEQAEGRFPRPGSTADKVNAAYLIAAGTIDDFLTTLVEEKRRNVKQTLDFDETSWDERSLMMDLAEVIAARGLRKWSL